MQTIAIITASQFARLLYALRTKTCDFRFCISSDDDGEASYTMVIETVADSPIIIGNCEGGGYLMAYEPKNDADESGLLTVLNRWLAGLSAEVADGEFVIYITDAHIQKTSEKENRHER